MPNTQSMVHDSFVAALKFYRDNGGTHDERELARIALTIYELTKWHEPVIQFVNTEAARVLEEQG